MREIKFRAFIHKHGRFVYSDEEGGAERFLFYKGRPTLKMPIEEDEYYYPMVIISQFTGLLDKNGKEIYEGDIVRDGVVEFKFGKWLIVNKRDDLKTKILYDAIHDTDKQEIIGNIYENPELLERR